MFIFIFLNVINISMIIVRVARRNPMVNDVISGQLHAHLMQYWKDEEGHHPIQFKKLFEFSPLKDIKAIFKVR